MQTIPPVCYQLNKPVYLDESTEYVSKIIIRPQSGSRDLNNSGVIILLKEADNKCIRLYKARINATLIYKTQKPAGTDLEAAKITLIMNALDHLFSNFTLKLEGKIVDDVSNPGTINQMYDIVRYGKTYSDLNECYVLDAGDGKAENNGWKIRMDHYNYDVANAATYREVELSRSLTSYSGFCELDRLIQNLQIEVNLTRTDKYKDAVFGEATSDTEGSQILQSISLELPVVKPNDDMLIHFNKLIKDTKKFDCYYNRRNSFYYAMNSQEAFINLGSRQNPPQ